MADVGRPGTACSILACALCAPGYSRGGMKERRGRHIKERFTIPVTVTCECTESWLVPLGEEEPASLIFTCPNCRGRARFSAGQAREIVAEYALVRQLLDEGRLDPAQPIIRADFGTRH